MRRPVLLHPDTVEVAKGLAATMPRATVADVIGVAVETVIEALATIHAAGLGAEPIKAEGLLARYAYAANLNAARAARTREIEA